MRLARAAVVLLVARNVKSSLSGGIDDDADNIGGFQRSERSRTDPRSHR
jgi:hypothetical protein